MRPPRAIRASLVAILSAVALAACASAQQPDAGGDAAPERAAEGSGDAEEPKTVGEGRTVSIEYTLTLGDGSEAGSNVGGKPLVFEQGARQILPALEEELAGMRVDDTTTITLPPEEGYGERDPEALRPVPASRIPEPARSAGAVVMMEGPKGSQRPVRVHAVKEDEVVLDLNHPLAGETLTFDVRVVSVE